MEQDIQVGDWVIIKQSMLERLSIDPAYNYLHLSGVKIRVESVSDIYEECLFLDAESPLSGFIGVHKSEVIKIPQSKKQREREEYIHQSEIKHKVKLITI